MRKIELDEHQLTLMKNLIEDKIMHNKHDIESFRIMKENSNDWKEKKQINNMIVELQQNIFELEDLSININYKQ